ncbi:uncharacterized protein LOC144910884 [Branchiostoma floridae x Branchiostoma belcheri]
MASLANKLQHFQLYLDRQDDHEVVFVHALREAIVCIDYAMQVEVLKSLGDLHLEKGKLSKDSAEFEKAAALYADALLHCTDPDKKQALEHDLELSELSRQLLQGYSPQYQWSQDYWGTADNSILRVAETCDKLDKEGGNIEQTYAEMLVTAIANKNVILELEVLKSLGDLYFKKGKKTLNVSQFSKAAAMYKKALTTCGDPETKQTLVHRALYMVKIWEGVRKQTSRLAEKHFAAALKKVHVRDPTAQQYQREVEPLCKLGDVYSKRGQQTGDGGDFVKAAALYNAAIARSEDQVLNGNIEIAIKEVEKSFFKCILGIHSNVSHNNTEKHKKQLREMRDQIKLEMETIGQQLDPYVHDEDDPCVKEIEAKRAQAARHLFERIAKERKEFISLLVEECIGLMGPSPCKYALIGLGSQATGLVTPYSDLEFAILVEKESEECLVYFRNITHYLHLKVVNLGETILPALGIKSLNDFYSKNPLDDWYYDSVTPRGFAFDGSMPKASKTPLGRQGTMNKPPSELICTPQNMVSILQNDVRLYMKEGYHLATILRNPCLIAGDKDLIDTYMAITVEILQADGGKMTQQLAQEILMENCSMYKGLRLITPRLIDVKKDIYRFPSLAVDCLALSSGIIPTTVWETIDKMEGQQVISPNNAHHLTVLTSISAELRLRTYIATGGQKEKLSALTSIETEQHGQKISLQTDDQEQTPLKQIFYLPNEKQLFRYYYTAIPLRITLPEWCKQKALPNSFSEFYVTTIKATMYTELGKYSQAISCYQEALKESDGNDPEKFFLLKGLGLSLSRMGDNQGAVIHLKEALSLARASDQSITSTDTAMSLRDLGQLYNHMGNHKKGISYLEQALQMYRIIYGLGTAHRYIAILLNMLGAAYSGLGHYGKAMSYLEQALQMYRSMYGENTAHPDIASVLNNLGITRKKLSDLKNAVSYLEQALRMNRTVFGYGTAHVEIATSLGNLGAVWYSLGDYKKSHSYHEMALVVNRSIYGQGTMHPHIALSLNNLGLALDNLGEKRKAISYYEQALQMHRIIYSKNTTHPDTVRILNNLGASWDSLGDHRKAISYHEQALQEWKSIHGHSTKHPDIAMSLIHLGQALVSLGDYRKAISHYEQALQMYKSIYGQISDHSDIVASLNNLGGAFQLLGKYRTAAWYYKQGLHMSRRIYGQNKAHPQIAESLSGLGSAFDQLADYREAISCHKQALQMRRSIHGQTAAHPMILSSLIYMGSAWHHQGDKKKAISYYEQGLQMCRSVYGQSTPHPQIATLLNNLGSAWGEFGDHSKAISFLEQALQMERSIYGLTTAHREIANTLNTLGIIWQALGNNKKALSLCQEALAMARQVFPLDKTHPLIKLIERNIATILS